MSDVLTAVQNSKRVYLPDVQCVMRVTVTNNIIQP